MSTPEWLSVKEGAALYQLNPEYFRRNYCDPGGILARMGGLRIRLRKAQGARRRIFVSRQVILDLIEQERKRSEVE